ncbi:hypothetical protein GCM10009804_17110 [Kribbella hippodromi]|uniref:Uncharacterized protein n=1 Tax=Kribbella hippodromi TaxID=434347 RepID=A0ABP4NG22_9ACTN
MVDAGAAFGYCDGDDSGGAGAGGRAVGEQQIRAGAEGHDGGERTSAGGPVEGVPGECLRGSNRTRDAEADVYVSGVVPEAIQHDQSPE